MRKATGNVLFIVSIILLISACSNSSRKKESNKNESEKISQQVFLIGNGPNSKKTISDLIEKSGIKTGGYVAILSMLNSRMDSSAFFLQKEFYDEQIMAVHIIDLHPGSDLKNTDVLTIENASILCILGGNKNKYMKLANNTLLKSVLIRAYENGTLITGIGKGAEILGDNYYSHIMDTISQSTKVIMQPGLGLLKNTVIDDITFFENYKEGIQENSKKKKFVFIGLAYKSAVWIINEDALVLGNSEIGLISPDKTIKKLNKGDEFKLISK